MIYTMMQVCKETNLTYQALKFYCNEGLIPNVKRDKNNRVSPLHNKFHFQHHYQRLKFFP